MIKVRNLNKNFRIVKRKSGLFGSLRNILAPEYQTIQAVKNISFEIGVGELVGYIGPNGAGKSTTLKLLTGLLVPSSGEILANGMVPWKQRTGYVRQIGAVFGQRSSLWWDLPVIDSFELLEPLYEIPREIFTKNLKSFTELLEMGSFINTPVRSLSLGQRMRAELAAALIHEPKIVFLDEPTIGLDVVAKERIREFIAQLHQAQKTTIILTTHDLADVERLCERILILDHGQLVYDGGLSALTERFNNERSLFIKFNRPYENPQIEHAELVELNGLSATYVIKSKEQSTEAIRHLLDKYEVEDIEIKHPPLEETIRKIYQGQLIH
jgi:ABC-2 type transport system ATP-binding protein